MLEILEKKEVAGVLEERVAVQGGESIFVLRKLDKKAKPTPLPRLGISAGSAAGAYGGRKWGGYPPLSSDGQGETVILKLRCNSSPRPIRVRCLRSGGLRFLR
jgi:hypothetical protein